MRGFVGYLCIGLVAGALGSVGAVAKTTITVAWSEDAVAIKNLKAAADGFERKYGIRAKITPLPWGDGDVKLLTMYSAGVAPDVFSSVYRSGVMDYALHGLCEDISPFIKRDRLSLDRFLPAALSGLTVSKKLIGLPLSTAPDALVCNTLLFEQAGVALPPTDWNTSQFSWDDMVEMASKLTRDKNGDGKADVWGYYDFRWPANVLAWTWGGDFFPPGTYETGIAKKSICTSPEVIDALQKYANLNLRHKVHGPGGGFAQGKVAMESGGMWLGMGYVLAKTPKAKLAWAVLPKGTHRIPTVFTNPWLISKNSKNKEAAWKWMRYTTVEEGATIMLQGGVTPTATHVGAKDFFDKYDEIPTLGKVILGGLQIGRESPNHTMANFPEILAAMEQAVAPIFVGKVSPADAMKRLEPKLDSILARTYAKFRK